MLATAQLVMEKEGWKFGGDLRRLPRNQRCACPMGESGVTDLSHFFGKFLACQGQRTSRRKLWDVEAIVQKRT
jgi:hypothetical protein